MSVCRYARMHVYMYVCVCDISDIWKDRKLPKTECFNQTSFDPLVHDSRENFALFLPLIAAFHKSNVLYMVV